jgi:hypothetical protein
MGLSGAEGLDPRAPRLFDTTDISNGGSDPRVSSPAAGAAPRARRELARRSQDHERTGPSAAD